MKKEKAAIYGAGYYCKVFLQSEYINEFDVVAIIDSDPQKKGTRLFGIEVDSFEDVDDCRVYIIAARDKEPIADLLMSHGITIDRIKYFDGDTVALYPYKKDLEYRFMIANSERQICFSLLHESYAAGEFRGYQRIVVLGEEKHYRLIEEFFFIVGERKKIVLGNQVYEHKQTDKYVITSGDYKQRIVEIRGNKEIKSKQWLVLPFFDVRDTVL